MQYLMNSAGKYASYNNQMVNLIMPTEPSVGSTLLNGLLGYYNCDETSGVIVADSLGVYDASITAGTVTRSTGKIGAKALSFESVDAIVTISPNVLDGKITNNQATISLWFTLDVSASTTGYYNRLFWAGDYALDIRISPDDDKLYFASRDTSNNIPQAVTVDPVGVSGTFRHLVCILNGSGGLTIYINGVDVTDFSDNQVGIFPTIDNVCFGNGHYAKNRALVGDIDEVGVWNRVLTTDEIAELYNSGTGKTYPFS